MSATSTSDLAAAALCAAKRSGIGRRRRESSPAALVRPVPGPAPSDGFRQQQAAEDHDGRRISMP